MKKAIIVTPFPDTGNTLSIFRNTGAKPGSIIVFLFRWQTERNLYITIRKERPRMVVLDGKMHPETLKNINDGTRDTIGEFDIDCKTYCFNKLVSLPGIQLVTVEDIVKILRDEN